MSDLSHLLLSVLLDHVCVLVCQGEDHPPVEYIRVSIVVSDDMIDLSRIVSIYPRRFYCLVLPTTATVYRGRRPRRPRFLV